MGKKKGLLYGWGTNDVDYHVTRKEKINGKWKRIWVCPYYKKWVDMLVRCFSSNFQERRPTYRGCTVSEDWKSLSNFIRWVDSQPNKDWIDCELDKDLLIRGNKYYSENTVVFITPSLNNFIKDRGNDRGGYMIGACYKPNESKKRPYRSDCCNPFTGKQEYLGYYFTELEAHKAWQAKKHELACQLADLQTDQRISSRLYEMYAPDKDWSKT